MNDDFIGGNSYNITDNQKKAKKWMKIIGVILIILFLLCAILLGLMFYIQTTETRVLIDGEQSSKLKQLFIFQDDQVYIPIRTFASQLGYTSANGEYKQYTEDTTKCYVQSNNEVATFSLDSKRIYKLNLSQVNADYEYYEISQPVKMINNQLCTTIEGIRVAFNLYIDAGKYETKTAVLNYNHISLPSSNNENEIIIYTLPYLVDYYATKNSNFSADSSFQNQKAILYDRLIIKDQNGYGVQTLDGKEILGTKYASIEFIEVTQDFIVTTSERKVGIMSYDAKTKINPQYDEVKQIDKKNGLYLVTTNQRQGVVNQNGSIIVYPEYQKIGVNMGSYTTSELENPYVLYDTCIPVCQANKWGLFALNGREIVPVQYKEFGCTKGSGNSSDSNVRPVILIPKIGGIIVQSEEGYGIINAKGEQIVPTVCDTIYTNTVSARMNYFMVYQNQVLNVLNFVGAQEEDDTAQDNQNTESTQNTTNNVETQNTTNSENNVNEAQQGNVQTNANPQESQSTQQTNENTQETQNTPQ